MSGGRTQTQTTTSNNAPWQPSQEYLKTGLEETQRLYDSESGFNPYPGGTVIGFSPETELSMQNIESLMMPNMDRFGGYQSGLRTIANNRGFNAEQLSALTGLRQGTASERNLGGIAAGNRVGASNPYVNQAINNASRQATEAANINASAAGRYGSATHAGNVARNVADIATNARLGQYNTDIGHQMQANSMQDQARLSRLGSLFNAGQQGLGNMQQAVSAQTLPAQIMQGIGSMREDLAGRELQDQIRLWEGNQQSDWTRLQNAMALWSGAGGLGGQQQASVSVPRPSPWGAIGGNALSGYAMTGSPWGAAIGGLSGLAGLF